MMGFLVVGSVFLLIRKILIHKGEDTAYCLIQHLHVQGA
jgi:hypothetical protein